MVFDPETVVRRTIDGLLRLASGEDCSRSVAPAVVIVLYLVPYLARARTLRRAGRRVPAWRIACFVSGLGVLGVAVTVPMDRAFAGHMSEHLLIGDIAPLLLVLGLSGPLLAPLLRRLRALAPLAHPALALALWALSLYALHLPPVFDLAVRNGAFHLVQHAGFFAGGMLMWLALLGPLPKPAWFGVPAQMAYLAVAWLVSASLGAALTFAREQFYSAYAVGEQSVGGALMMVEQSVLVLALLCWLFLRLLDRAGERQELADLAAARGVALDPRRAERAVDAGRAAALRDRIEAAP